MGVVVQQGAGCKSVNLHSGPGLGTNEASVRLGQHSSIRGILAPAFFFFTRILESILFH
jgi:hypothetical protein